MLQHMLKPFRIMLLELLKPLRTLGHELPILFWMMRFEVLGPALEFLAAFFDKLLKALGIMFPKLLKLLADLLASFLHELLKFLRVLLPKFLQALLKPFAVSCHRLLESFRILSTKRPEMSNFCLSRCAGLVGCRSFNGPCRNSPGRQKTSHYC